MAGVKISSLTSSASFSDTDVLPIVSGGVTKKVTGAIVKAAIGVPPAGSVGSTQLANGSVTSPKFAAGAVNAAAIGTSAVETAKINDSAVTTPKLADNNVTSAKLSSALRADISRGAQARSGTTIPTTGSVKGIVILAGGSGYVSAPTVTIAAPPSGVTATATATIVAGVVTEITITDGGSGYTDQNPTVTFSGGGGSGATAVAYAMVQPLLSEDTRSTRPMGYAFVAISSNDSIIVAGSNYQESLGIGAIAGKVSHAVQVNLVDSSGVRYKPVRLFSSGDSLYVLANDGSLWSCGYNGYGQLGRGFTGDSTTLAQNNGRLQKITFSGGGVVEKFAVNLSTGGDRATCIALVRTSSGRTLYGWGNNDYGQLGDGTTGNANTPQILNCSDGANTITDIASVGRSRHSNLVVLFSSGRAKASGYNGHAQLSRGNTTQPASPTFEFVNVSAGTPLSNIVEISGSDANYSQLYFRTSAGRIYACGYGGNGELGQGASSSTSTYMVEVSGGATYQTGAGRYIYASGGYTVGHAFTFKSDGTLVAWGYNGYSQLGDGTATSKNSPVPISGFTLSTTSKIAPQANEVASATGQTAILKTDGTIWVCGYNNAGKLGVGNDTTQASFVQVPFDKSIVKDIIWVCKWGNAQPYLGILTTDGSFYTTGNDYEGSSLRGDATGDIYIHAQGRL